MDWIDIAKKKPKHKQVCIVLTRSGRVLGAIRHKGWMGGFCDGDGISGFGVEGVTHWVKFVKPEEN
jgi:hypothetical protein